MDLKRFRMKKYDDSVTTKIGELAVFNLSGMYYEELLGKLGGTITKSSPVEFVRAIIPFICYPINSLEDEKYRPTPSLILKDEDIANLSESEIEEIARIYVVNNEDLFRSHIYKDRNDEDGKIVKYLEYADVKYPKKYDENYVHYLHRLLIIQENYYREQREELKTKSLRYTNFSQRLRNDIFKTFNLGESLRGTLPVTPASTTPDFPHMDNITEIIQTNEETRLRPYRMLSEKLEHLIDKSDKTVEFLVSMNLTQTEIAEEIKRSSDSAERSSGSNLRLTKKIFIWTIVGTLITACGVLYSIHVSQQSVTNSVVESHANKIIDVLTKIENTNSQTQLKPQSNEKELVEVVKELVEEIRQLRKFNETEMLLLRQRLQKLEGGKVR